MYQALYRKYRPRSFSDVSGQEHITETLRRQIILGRLSHAYLFVGARGTGKTTCAKILSRAVNCQTPVEGDPCNKCSSCAGIESGAVLDVLELDAASNNGVDNVRALREEAVFSPASVSKRVYIVDEVHMLSNAAFNALLKILEEPPQHLIFILATTELHKVPATIMSRCQRFSFKRLSPSVIAARLNSVAEKEGLNLTSDAAERLSALADGSMRDALSLLDQCASDTLVDLPRVLDTIGLSGRRELLSLAEAVAGSNIESALDILDKLYSDGRDMVSLLNELAALARDILIYKLSQNSPLLGGGFTGAELSKLSAKLPPERLLAGLDLIREALISLSRGGSVKITAEMCVIRLCAAGGRGEERGERREERGELECGISRNVRQSPQISSPASPASPASSVSSASPASLASPAESRPPSSSGTPAAGEGVSEAPAVPGGSDVREISDVSKAPVIPDITGGSDVHGILSGSDVSGVPCVQDISDIPGGSEVPSVSDVPGDTPVLPVPDKREAQAPPPASPIESGADFWQDILHLLKDDAPVHALLGDKNKVQAELQDGSLIIRSGCPFTINSIESSTISGVLKEAARKTLGREVVLRVETSSGDEKLRHDKLDRLKAFDNVKFEGEV